MLKIGDKIKMISKIGKYDMVGQIFEITDIVDNTYEILNPYLGHGCMSEDEFEKHFEKVEQKQTKYKVIVNKIELEIHDELKFINPENDNPNFNIFKDNYVWVKNIDNDCITVVGACGTLKFNKNDIFKVFTNVSKFNKNKKWTPWIETKSGFSYRTDNVKYVKVKKDGIVVKASTHPCDTFNLAKGIAVCLQKIENKKVNEKAKSVEIKYSKIIYDSKFDILYIDFIGRAVDEYVEKINNEIYLRKNLYTDDVIGIYIENYRNQVLEATGLGKKLIKDGLY